MAISIFKSTEAKYRFIIAGAKTNAIGKYKRRGKKCAGLLQSYGSYCLLTVTSNCCSIHIICYLYTTALKWYPVEGFRLFPTTPGKEIAPR